MHRQPVEPRPKFWWWNGRGGPINDPAPRHFPDAAHQARMLPGAERIDHPYAREQPMPFQVRSAGCMFSIIASIVLTILLNVGLRACSG
jgi:hypothetical protein